MTVTTTTARNVKVGNGVTTSFPFDFQYEVNTELVVTLVVDATGVETLQTLTTDYTTTGGAGATGSIEMIVAPATGETLVIERILPFTQAVDYQRNDPFPAEVNETALDKLTFLVQQALDASDRSLKLKKTTTLTDVTMPDPEVDKLLVGKSATEFENKSLSDIDPTAVTLPLSIANGGTNSVTAAAALIALGALGNTGNQTITSTDAGVTAGPDLVLDRDSASPASNDDLGRVVFTGRDDGDNTTEYGAILAEILDVTGGAEDGQLLFQTMVSAALATRMRLENGLIIGNPTGGDQGAGTFNCTGAFIDGVEIGKVLQVVTTQTGALQTGTTLIQDDDTIPSQTSGEFGDEYVTGTITPSDNANILIIDVILQMSSGGSGRQAMALFQDTTGPALAASHAYENAVFTHEMTLRHIMMAGTTSATTFKVRAGADNTGTTTINGESSGRLYGGVMASSMIIKEIAA